MGPKKRIDPRGLIERHIEEIGADYADLYFINDEVRYQLYLLLKTKLGYKDENSSIKG